MRSLEWGGGLQVNEGFAEGDRSGLEVNEDIRVGRWAGGIWQLAGR
jgi:hypothetical protein